jgi:DNA-binding transcriptional regulator LsrR (DeoR family)
MIEQGVTNSELARRIGVRETVVRRMLDPDLAEEAGPGVVRPGG